MDATDVKMTTYKSSTEEGVVNSFDADDNNKVKVARVFNFRIPKNSNIVAVEESIIKKIRKSCAKGKKQKFPWAEVLLGVASLFIGTALGAVVSSVPYELSVVSILSYNVMPILGVGCAVAYVFCRKIEMVDILQLTTEIDDLIKEYDDIENEGRMPEEM